MFPTETGVVKMNNERLLELYDDLKMLSDLRKGAKGDSNKEKANAISERYKATLDEIRNIHLIIKTEDGMALPFPKRHGKLKIPKV